MTTVGVDATCVANGREDGRFTRERRGAMVAAAQCTSFVRGSEAA